MTSVAVEVHANTFVVAGIRFLNSLISLNACLKSFLHKYTYKIAVTSQVPNVGSGT